MPSRFRWIEEQFRISMKGFSFTKKRDVTCVKYVDKMMPMAVGKFYIERLFNKDIKTEVI